jgi:hypothetical protein
MKLSNVSYGTYTLWNYVLNVTAFAAPSRASKQSVRDARLDHRDRRIVSPTMALSHSLTPSNSHGNGLLKFGISSAVIPAAAPLTLVDKLSHIKPVALQQPEEVTDNWDDDFEGGIPITKLQCWFLNINIRCNQSDSVFTSP